MLAGRLEVRPAFNPASIPNPTDPERLAVVVCWLLLSYYFAIWLFLLQ
jgi:hypothetical protein